MPKVYTAAEISSILKPYGIDIAPSAIDHFAAGRGRYVIDYHTVLTVNELLEYGMPADGIAHYLKRVLTDQITEIIPTVWTVQQRKGLEDFSRMVQADISFLINTPQPQSQSEAAENLKKISQKIKELPHVY